jgi:hypothetical protein
MSDFPATWRRRVTTLLRKPNLLVATACCFLIGATAAFPQAAPSSPAAPATQAAQSPPPPPIPAPFDDALLRAANDLFSKATVPPGDGKIELVIDPLIDGISGAQSTATRLMQERIVALVKKSYPRFEFRPFSTEALMRAPVVLIGTFTAITMPASRTGHATLSGFALRLPIRSKSIVSGVARPAGGDRCDADPGICGQPVWATDPATSIYINPQGTKPGDPIDPVYVETSAPVADRRCHRNLTAGAIGRWRHRTPQDDGRNQLRVLIYLAN